MSCKLTSFSKSVALIIKLRRLTVQRDDNYRTGNYWNAVDGSTKQILAPLTPEVYAWLTVASTWQHSKTESQNAVLWKDWTFPSHDLEWTQFRGRSDMDDLQGKRRKDFECKMQPRARWRAEEQVQIPFGPTRLLAYHIFRSRSCLGPQTTEINDGHL